MRQLQGDTMPKIKSKFAILIFIILNSLLSCAFADHFLLSSPDFSNNELIPNQFTCYGQNIQPTLQWVGTPEKTKSLVLIVEDPDAPNPPKVHWLLFNIPATTTALISNKPLPEGTLVGFNSMEQQAYYGPCPPKGSHHYLFTLYALKKPLTVNSNVHREDIINAMDGLILKKTRLVGIYEH